MRFLVVWTVKLGFLAILFLALTTDLRLRLPPTVLGMKVPDQARQWVDRNGDIGNVAARAHAGLRQISDSLRVFAPF
ncbi:hypothetical protein [Reyranella sp.]|uniref:hypothetical protein n=1 Tax=Reyranella sp. TaxID=1929291 RepID=UPI003BAAF78A